MKMVEPISNAIQRKIIILVNNYITQAENIFNRQFKPIDILFDLKGRSAGMYKLYRGKRVIRFNPYHFAKYPDENMSETIPHEVAHYIADQVYGIRNIRPHGQEWQALMLKFGVQPKRTFSYSLDGIPTRAHKKFAYRCSCTQYEITTRRHNKIKKGLAAYSCRQCGKKIQYLSQVA